MLDNEYTQTMHGYFNAVLRMRQDLRQRVQRKLGEYGHADITMEMTQVLYYIHFIAKEQKTNQQDIADRTGKNKASVTSLIDNLVKRNLVERKMDPRDRRSNIITLTEEGLKFVEEIYDKVYKTFDLAKSAISLEQLKKMTTMMESLMEN
ncbi:MarR family transcriptional regulator [Chryseobacterium sp. NRRL B-14859]|uniref:MarR family winged helix-turn-helix transcriptional regulator n=1 Tax=unclassified Chryseobacterium TaxID=2593645 RepID=UPI000F45C55D|nr:MarR family transcriptional regulator [Chryseobacterium sp. G0240]ROI03245.1 MarR family transcriptional regulator [Chryseobacterium sp. G0240]